MTTIYYPRAKSINFYDAYGCVSGGMRGNVAKRKFWRLVKSFHFPRISFRKHIKIML